MALAFGISKYLRFETPGDVAGNPLSVAFWFYPDVTTPSVDNWLLRGGYSGGVYCFRLETVPSQPGQLRFRVGYSTSSLVHDTSSNSYTSGRWNHVLVTWDGTQNASGVTIYVDGSAVSSSFLFDGAGTQYGSLWYWDLGHNTLTVGLEGKLAEGGVWTRVLAAGERASLAAGYSPLLFPKGLVFAPPLVRDAVDPISGQVGSASVTPPAAFAHPPCLRSAGPLAVGRAGSGAGSRVPWHLFTGSAV
jgi:hypothetical protein